MLQLLLGSVCVLVTVGSSYRALHRLLRHAVFFQAQSLCWQGNSAAVDADGIRHEQLDGGERLVRLESQAEIRTSQTPVRSVGGLLHLQSSLNLRADIRV